MLKQMLKNASHLLPDKTYIRLKYFMRLKRFPNLKNPQTFNEKLQWLKLYNRKPIYTTMVDKYEAKKYVADLIGEEYVIPTLGVWNSFEEIDFDALPNQFVLKCTHDSGGLVICRDKSKLDIEKAKKKIEASLKNEFFYDGREWPYKNVKPRIIAEKYMEDSITKELRDYKIYCFDGQAKLLMMASNRFSEIQTRFDYFDRDYNCVDLYWGNPPSEEKPKKPALYEKLFVIAEKLSVGTPHVRVDLYIVDEKIYFGEMTFFDGSGIEKIEPYEWDKKMGSWITLPEKTEE